MAALGVRARKASNATSVKDQKTLALWAADCAERVLAIFEEHRPKDNRPRKAIEAARAWTRDEIRCGVARAAAVASHAAARNCNDVSACAAARAAGHAVATAHMATHAPGAAAYAIKAIIARNPDTVTEKERFWQTQQLPRRLRPFATFHPAWRLTSAPRRGPVQNSKPAPRLTMASLPKDFSEALKQKSLAAFFLKSAPSHQKEFLRWIVEAGKPETRATRIAKAMKMLAEKLMKSGSRD